MRKRTRMSEVRVLLADKDVRTASLVQRVLNTFGFEHITQVTSVEDALRVLKEEKIDLIVTEWNMGGTDGITLVKTIRAAKDARLIKRDIPIIMLTGKAERKDVITARDSGISEFIAKPFSARAMSSPLIQIVDNPRPFVVADDYVGPCRRRRREALPPEGERRGRRQNNVLPPNRELFAMIGVSAGSILDESMINMAQDELQKASDDFHTWVDDDVRKLTKAYNDYRETKSQESYNMLVEMAYSIKSLAGVFGYDLGTQVARMMVNYLEKHPELDTNNLIVVKKHIDTIVVVFSHQVKESGRDIAIELIASLEALTNKLG